MKHPIRPHTATRMRERGVSEAEIDEVLASAGNITYQNPNYPGTTTIRGRTSGGRLLKVFVLDSDLTDVTSVAEIT